MAPGSHITEQYRDYLVTTDKSLMNLADIHCWLSEVAYWSIGIPYETVKTAFDNSFCIGVMHGDHQVAFARLATDYSTFAYLADVYVEEAHRGNGLSIKMLDMLFGLDWVKRLRRIMLSTIHGHSLYARYGFKACRHQERIMEILQSPDMYHATQDITGSNRH